MKVSQSALEPLEELDRLLPELELLLQRCGIDGASAVDERSASETNSSLVIASRDVHGFIQRRHIGQSAECGVRGRCERGEKWLVSATLQSG